MLEEIFGTLPDTGRQAGKTGSAERSRFDDGGALDGDAEDVGLELHEEIVRTRAAIDLQAFQFYAHEFRDVARLIRERFQRGTGEVRLGRGAREADDCAARGRVPVRR